MLERPSRKARQRSAAPLSRCQREYLMVGADGLASRAVPRPQQPNEGPGKVLIFE
jgi:hypothetical protein